MKYLKIFFITLIFLSFSSYSFTADIHFIDMKKILNKSKAGKSAQDYLKKKLKDETKKFDKEQAELKKEETELIAKKKLISAEEYKKSLNNLRKKNLDHQKNRQKAANEIFQKKEKARQQLNTALKPILEKYMSENNVMMILNEKNVVLANTKRDLTKTIIGLLDKELKSIKLN